MRAAFVALLVLAASGPGVTSGAWPQWGGPNRDFTVAAANLADSWPEGGPRRLWQRPLGDGFSSIVTDGTTLYTLYREGDEDVAIAMDTRTGETRWTAKYAAPFRETCSERLGPAPRAAPLIHGDRLITVTSGGSMHSLDRRTGAHQWTTDLLDGAAGAVRACGFSTSPLAYKDTIITTAGGKGRGVLAIDAQSGRIAWQSQDFQNGYSSPILIDLEGLEQLVVLLDGAMVGLNPHNGDLQWQVPFKADYSIAVATPLWGPGNLLFVSAEYNAGAKVVELRRNGLQTSANELWSSNRLRLHHGNAMRLGDTLYFSSGGKGSQAILSAVDARSGKIHWQERSIEKATFVWADGKLITLDQSGALMIAYPSTSGFKIAAKAPLLSEIAWTPPVLVGTRLYMRDRRSMVAVDLS